MQLHECQNCGKKFHEEQLNTVIHLGQRVAPGEPMPSGKCPECGAVCHPVAIKRNTASDNLNDDLDAITQSLANTMIDRKLSTKTMLTGIHAFLLALQESGHADASEISEELLRMTSCYHSFGGEVQA